MRWPDRLVCVTSIAIALGGHLLVTRVALALDPALCVAVAWERANEGREPKMVTRTPVDSRGRLLADPWGFPFRWEPEPDWVDTVGLVPPDEPVFLRLSCWRVLSYPVSRGPDGVTSSDDVPVKPLHDWPRWQRSVALWPRLASALAATYVALAWAVLRAWRVRGVAADVLCAALVVLPLGPVLWLAATTERAGEVGLMRSVIVPAPVALTASAWALALLLALAVRTRARLRVTTA